MSVLRKEGWVTYFVGPDNYFSHAAGDAAAQRMAIATLIANLPPRAKYPVSIAVVARQWTTVPLDEIEGHLMPGFRDFRATFRKVAADLSEAIARIGRLDQQMIDPPEGFEIPDNWSSLKARPGLLQEELQETLPSDAERLLVQLDSAAKVGNFQPLMQEARRLLEAPKATLGALAGDLVTVENRLAGYRIELLASHGISERISALNTLERVKHRQWTPRITFVDLAAEPSLRAARQKVAELRTVLDQTAGELLIGTSTDFDEWLRVVANLEEGQDPDLTDEQANALVTHGFIRRT